jgi:hypothetical protein
VVQGGDEEMTAMRLVLQNKDIIGKFSAKFNILVLGVRVDDGETFFLFSDGEYYSKKAMEESL